jgi:hypothetical protein
VHRVLAVSQPDRNLGDYGAMTDVSLSGDGPVSHSRAARGYARDVRSKDLRARCTRLPACSGDHVHRLQVLVACRRAQPSERGKPRARSSRSTRPCHALRVVLAADDMQVTPCSHPPCYPAIPGTRLGRQVAIIGNLIQQRHQMPAARALCDGVDSHPAHRRQHGIDPSRAPGWRCPRARRAAVFPGPSRQRVLEPRHEEPDLLHPACQVRPDSEHSAGTTRSSARSSSSSAPHHRARTGYGAGSYPRPAPLQDPRRAPSSTSRPTPAGPGMHASL